MILVTDTNRGGTPTRLARVARGMKILGWEIMFVSVLPAGPVLTELREEGFETVDLQMKRHVDALTALFKLRRLLSTWRPTVVHSTLWHANLLARLSAIGTAVPVVNGHASVDDDKSLGRIIADRATHRLAARHAAVSTTVASRVSARDWVPRKRILVIPPCVRKPPAAPDRAGTRAALGIPNDAKVVVWAGRLHPVKDLVTLVKATSLLPNFWLLLVGDGNERETIRRAAKATSVAERLVMTGDVRDVLPYMAAGDVFCLTSRWEGLPNSLLEAMSLGLPVVATSVGGIPEVLHSGGNGLLVPPGSPHEVASAIQLALANPDLGQNAQNTIQARFDCAQMFHAHQQLWEEVGGEQTNTESRR